jgi:hypothetical protein
MPKLFRFRRRLVPAVLLLAPALLTACDALIGKEIARLPLNALSTPGQEVAKEASVQLPKGAEVALWSDMDLSYEGEVGLQMQVQVLQDGRPFRQLAFDPREKNLSIKEARTSVNDKVSWSFSGKNATLLVPAAGRYTFRARLVAEPGAAPQIRKAELVLRR